MLYENTNDGVGNFYVSFNNKCFTITLASSGDKIR